MIKLKQDENLVNSNITSKASKIEDNRPLVDLTSTNQDVDDNEDRKQSVMDHSWYEVKLDLKKLPQYYLKLSKQNLTSNIFNKNQFIYKIF